LEGVLKKDPAQDYNKKGAKYELDRENWTTYANFSDMYLHIYDEMENAKVATCYDKPMWQDFDGNPYLEKDAFGCKVTYNLTHPHLMEIQLCVLLFLRA